MKTKKIPQPQDDYYLFCKELGACSWLDNPGKASIYCLICGREKPLASLHEPHRSQILRGVYKRQPFKDYQKFKAFLDDHPPILKKTKCKGPCDWSAPNPDFTMYCPICQHESNLMHWNNRHYGQCIKSAHKVKSGNALAVWMYNFNKIWKQIKQIKKVNKKRK